MLRLNTQKGRIYVLLSANRGKRVSILQIFNVSWSFAVSTKISELRNRYNLVIENKQKKQKNGIVFSRYCLKRWQIKNAELVGKR